jgi:hypothetical protein
LVDEATGAGVDLKRFAQRRTSASTDDVLLRLKPKFFPWP